MTASEPADLDALIADFIQAAEQGQAPDPADWLARHPAHAPLLGEFLLDLGRFATFLGLPSPSGDATMEFRPPGSDPVGVPAATDGERFGEYLLLAELGKGGMGTVYRARLAGTNLVVALKQVRPRGLDRAETVRRFREEVENAARLRHPNIVPIYYAGEHAGQPFYTMALVEGGSLDQCLGRFRKDPRGAATLLAKVARAVHHAHQRRVVHRDIKPANILLDEDGEPHVADFGLAARLDGAGAASDAGPPAGSLPWMAPEAVRGDPGLTTAVDVWALGVILYELLTGERPFGGPQWGDVRQAILERDLTPPRTVSPDVPRDLDAICRRCLEKDPDRRYESASAVALELERWLRDEPVRARPAGRAERLARWCRRSPGMAGGVVFTASLLVAVTIGSIRLANDLEDEVAASVCANCEYDASQVAGNVLGRFDKLGKEVQQTAKTVAGDRSFPGKKGAAVAALQKLVLTPVGSKGSQPFVNAFLLDQDGVIQLIWPPDPDLVGNKNLPFSGRDYFERAGRAGAHVSRAFESENDKLDKLAISVRFRPIDTDHDWVLAATVTTDRSIDLGVVMHDDHHTAILVAPRDSDPPRPGAKSGPEGYAILVHPALPPRAPTKQFGTKHPDPAQDNGLPELGPSPPGQARPFERNANYKDPFADRDTAYKGRWLYGSARVGNTELVVVVQQRYETAVTPHLTFVRRFVSWVAGAFGIGLLAFLVFRQLGPRRAPAVPHAR
jgi:serine/threonine-protein kinase